MEKTAIARYGISIRFACQCLSISESCYYYDPKFSSENAKIADWLLRLTATHKRWGCQHMDVICLFSKYLHNRFGYVTPPEFGLYYWVLVEK